MSNSVGLANFFDNVGIFFKDTYKMLATDGKLLYFSASYIVKGVQGIGVLAIENPLAKLALAVAGVVQLAFEFSIGIPRLHDLRCAREDFAEQVHYPNPYNARERKIDDITRACSHIARNEKSIRKSFDIVKEANLQARAQEILHGLQSDQIDEQDRALEKGEQFTHTLRRHVDAKFGIELARLTFRIAGVAVAALLVSNSANPINLILAGVAGTATLAFWAVDKIMLPRNPFAEPSKWTETVPHHIRKSVFVVSDAITNLFMRRP